MNNSIGFLLGKAYRDMHSIIAIHLKPYDVTLDQWILLKKLNNPNGIPQKELASETCKDQSNTARIIDQLARKQLAERKANEKDRRSFLIRRTHKANTLLHEMNACKEKALAIATAGLPADQIDLFKKTLRQISTNIEQYEAAKFAPENEE